MSRSVAKRSKLPSTVQALDAMTIPTEDAAAVDHHKKSQKKPALKSPASLYLEKQIRSWSKRVQASRRGAIPETDSEDEYFEYNPSRTANSYLASQADEELEQLPDLQANYQAQSQAPPRLPGAHPGQSPSQGHSESQLELMADRASFSASEPEGELELPPAEDLPDHQAKDFADMSGFEIDLDFNFDVDVPAKKKVRDPEFKDDGYPLVPAGKYSCPPPTSRFNGLLMAFDGEPVRSKDFERMLKASVTRCLPDTSRKWLSEDCLAGKKSILREMAAAFGEGLSRKYILKRACHIMETRRSNHRRRAATGQSKPTDLSEATWQAHLAYKSSKTQSEATRSEARRPRVVNRLGSGGWSSICNICVNEWGFVPTKTLKRKAVEVGAVKFMAALRNRNLPPRDPNISVAEIWARNAAINKKTINCLPAGGGAPSVSLRVEERSRDQGNC